jgi:hypothetical protein
VPRSRRSRSGAASPRSVTSDARGELGAPVTPHTLDDHVHDNFRWNGRPPVPAGEVWEALERQPEASVALVSERVRHELSDDAMLDRELALLDELAGRRESREALLAAVSRYAAEVGGALVAEHRGRVRAEDQLRRTRERLVARRERVAGPRRRV